MVALQCASDMCIRLLKRSNVHFSDSKPSTYTPAGLVQPEVRFDSYPLHPNR